MRTRRALQSGVGLGVNGACAHATASVVESLEQRTLFSSAATPLAHLGLLETDADFVRMKEKVLAGAHPWVDSWNRLIVNAHAQLSYTPNPVAILIRGTTTAGAENYSRAYNDAAAAYQTAIRWKITGDTAYADKAVEILNAWGSTCTQVTGDSNSALASGLYGYEFAAAGEIMRNYSGWAAADFTQFKSMMVTAFLSNTNAFLSTHWGTTWDHYWANWDLCNIAAKMAIGVLCDDYTTYNDALTYFKSGIGNGNVNNGLYFWHPGKMGQWQESGRDQGHATLAVPLLGAVAQMAWNQGDDLYSYNDNAILGATEYIAKYNLNNDVPYVTYINSDVVQTTISAASRGTLRASFQLIYDHYVNQLGLAAPYTGAYLAQLRPDGGGGDYGPNSGGYDQLGFNTLTDTLDPIATGQRPTSLVAAITGTQAQLSWWGTSYATSYNVKRATAVGGPYTTIATGITGATTFIDYGLTPAQTYYYVVSAVAATGESANSDPASALADKHLMGTTIGSAGSFNSTGAGIQTVYDGSLRNYYDAANATGDWAGLDFGAGITNVITQVRYVPRASFSSRMVGGVFEGSNTPDFSSGVVTLYTVASSPAQGVWTTANVTNVTPFRYVRYRGPSNGQTNVAEIEFDGYNAASAVPSVPSGLTGVGTSAGVSLTWTASTGAVAYDIRRAISSSGPFTTIETGVTTTSYLDPNAGDGVTYYYTIAATNAAGSSADTGSTTVTTLARPSGLGATAGLMQVSLSWTASALATGYLVKRADSPGGAYTTLATVTTTNYSDTTVNPWMPCYYIVTATDGSDESRSTSEISAIPSAGKLSGTTLGTTGSFNSDPTTTRSAALDGDVSTGFDAPSASGGWVGLDLGTPTVISYIRYSPRIGNASRMVSGTFQASTNSGFSSPVTLATISATPTVGYYTTVAVTNPTAYRYVRYLGPTGGYCNVAEIEFYSSANTPPTIAAAAVATTGAAGSTVRDLGVLGADVQGESKLKYTWSVISTAPAPVAFTANGTNAAKNPTAMFIKAGTYDLRCTVSDGTYSTVSVVTINVNSVLSSLVVSPDALAMKKGDTQAFTVTAYDQFGEVMTTPSITWSLGGGSAGSINASGLYTASAVGSATIVASSGSVNDSASVTVGTGVPTVATPASVATSTVTGTTVAVSVLGADDGGEASLVYRWSVASGPASVAFSANNSNAAKSAVATFHAAGAYVLAVTMTDAGGNSVSSSVSVTVVQTPSKLSVTPASASIGTGTTRQLAATALDQFGAVIVSPALAWSVTSGAGSVSNTGLFTAPTTVGKTTVRASLAGLNASSILTTFSWAPYNLAIRAVTSNTLQVSFRDSTTIETGFQLQVGVRQSNGSVLWTTVYTLSALAGSGGTMTYTVPQSFTAGTWYFRARAVNASGASNWSNTASKTL